MLSRDSRSKARLLPEAIRIICAPGARACGGSDRGAKAGISKYLAPTRGKMRKVRELPQRGFVCDPTIKMHKTRISFEPTCLDTVSANRTPRFEKSLPRDRRWKAGPTSGPIRPLRAPGTRGGWGRARGARRGFARRDAPREIPEIPDPPPRTAPFAHPPTSPIPLPGRVPQPFLPIAVENCLKEIALRGRSHAPPGALSPNSTPRVRPASAAVSPAPAGRCAQAGGNGGGLARLGRYFPGCCPHGPCPARARPAPSHTHTGIFEGWAAARDLQRIPGITGSPAPPARVSRCSYGGRAQHVFGKDRIRIFPKTCLTTPRPPRTPAGPAPGGPSSR
eukprot:gene11113-biopygen3333